MWPPDCLTKPYTMLSPRPAALADRLGGEERLEHLVADFGRHAAAGVADRQHHIGAGPHLGIGLGIGLVEHDVAGLQQQLAAVRHRVAGVDRHVEHGIGELRRIDMGDGDAAFENGLDLDLLAQRRPQQLGDVLHRAVDVDIARLQRLTAGKCQQMLDQFGAALGRVVDQSGDALQFAAGAPAPPPAFRWCRRSRSACC